jgi:phage terminase large subunit-like protein
MERLTGGAKGTANLDRLPTKGFPKAGPKRIIRWIESFIVVPRGIGARKPMKLHRFQRDIIEGVFGDPQVRSALVSMPRGNAKTTTSAALALWALMDSHDDDPEVLCVASDERTAGILLDTARRMVELNPLLAERIVPYKDRLVCPGTNGVLRALPSREAALHGWNPGPLLILDELHLCPPEVWTACITAAGKRERSLVLAISTPAASRESVMWQLVEHGRKGADPSFKYLEWAAPDGCAVDDEEAWRIANPALAAGILAIDGIRSTLRTTKEQRFRQLRLGQWTERSDDAWLGWTEWMGRADPSRIVEPGARIVAGWDGSYSEDDSCLIAIDLSDLERPHMFVAGWWSRPEYESEWRVPRDEVDLAVARLFTEYDCRYLSCDVAFWQAEVQTWTRRWPDRVLEHPQSAPRMARSMSLLEVAIREGRLTHDGDPRLALHVANVVSRDTVAGPIPQKRSRNSRDRIDGAIAAMLAYERAADVLSNPPDPARLPAVIFV